MKYFLIFDMDETLYDFDTDDSSKTRFFNDAMIRAYKLIGDTLNIDQDKSRETFKLIEDKYKSDVSIGLEKEFKIDRYEYFEKVWSPDPAEYIKKKSMRNFMLKFNNNSAILTEAPRSWAKKVLEYLDIYDLYKDKLFTGEPDIRKPNPLAFQNILDYFNISPNNAISIGDKVLKDIIPAKKIGLKTILVKSKSDQVDLCINDLEDLIFILEGGLI